MNGIKGMVQIFNNSRKVYLGFRALKRTQKTPNFAYDAMKRLFVQTNGVSNDVISKFVRRKKYDSINREGVLGINSSEELRVVINNIREDGYHIFDKKLGDEQIEAIITYARNAPCRYRVISPDSKKASIEFSKEVVFDESRPVSPVYQFSSDRIVACDQLRELIFDQSLLMVAQEYLETRPVMDLIAMWWSLPYGGRGKSESAQMYHFDLDRIKFIKFFFYLTDVDPETGPHCYVRGSHKRLPASLQKQGRMNDSEVEAAFGRENLVELCGRKGTIMAVDTRGLHKGKDLSRDRRLLFQIEFANSMFGQFYPAFKKPVLTDKQAEIFFTYNDTYKEIMS